MTTTSRGLSRRSRQGRPSQTPGKDKGERCTKSALKEFGRTANPYKLRGGRLDMYNAYCALVNGLNK